MNTHHHQHPSAEKLQALLEGELRGRELAAAEEHLAGCARCSSELEGWRTLFAELGELPVLEPSSGFARRVLGAIEPPRTVPLAARVRRRLEALVRPRPERRHVGDWLQELMDGTLPVGRAARAEAHLAACSDCSAEAEGWRELFGRLGTLGRFAPAEGFADRVMAALAASAAVAAARPATVPAWTRLLAATRAVVPRTRRAWAALSGVAVTPAVTAGLALWVLLSHPTLTPGALLSFTWWKVGELGTAVWQTVSSTALESAQLFGLYSLFEALAAAPMAVAGGVLAYSMGSALAARVLYKNLIAPRRSSEPSHA